MIKLDEAIRAAQEAYSVYGKTGDLRASPPSAGNVKSMLVERIQFRIDAMNERGLDGVSISKGFAAQIVRACRRGAELLENPEPAKERGPRK